MNHYAFFCQTSYLRLNFPYIALSTCDTGSKSRTFSDIKGMTFHWHSMVSNSWLLSWVAGYSFAYLYFIDVEILGFSQFSSVQSLSHVRLFATPWIAARQASLSITKSRSSLKLTSIKLVMPSSHLILRRPLLLPPIPPCIRVFSNESTLCMR